MRVCARVRNGLRDVHTRACSVRVPPLRTTVARRLTLGSSTAMTPSTLPSPTQVDLMARTFETGVSSFGSCWGLQIAAVACGGKVELNPNGREVGVGRKVMLSGEGRDHPMFR